MLGSRYPFELMLGYSVAQTVGRLKHLGRLGPVREQICWVCAESFWDGVVSDSTCNV